VIAIDARLRSKHLLAELIAVTFTAGAVASAEMAGASASRMGFVMTIIAHDARRR